MSEFSKRQTEKHGVFEYWIVDPGNKFIQILTLEDESYREYTICENDGTVTSKKFKDLVIDLKDIF